MHQFEIDPPRLEDVDDLDAATVVAGAEALVRRRRGIEADELRLVARWADLHSAEPPPAPSPAQQRFGDRLIMVGGPGSPRVQEFCLAELAVARNQHPIGMRQTMADVLDLKHRLPRCWDRVQALASDAWVACRVARLTHHLSAAQAEVVDLAVADMLGAQAPSRVFTVVEAKIIEADPDRYAAEIEAEATRRCVKVSQSNDHGLRTIFARLEAGDATWVEAMVDRVATILRERGEPGSRDELRATAFGWLARPAELLALLLEHQPPARTPRPSDPEPPDAEPEPTDPEPAPSRAFAFPAELLDALRCLDPARLRPPATLHVHLHQAALEGLADGVARCEELGPFLPDQLHDLLGRADVTVAPVIDLADQISANAYEHPESVKNRVFHLIGGDYFPYAPSLARHLDIDHVTPYRPHGPPGQTGVHNAGPLTRLHHRIKTHANGWAVRQPQPGIYVWRTPHNLYRIVTHTGTHPLTSSQAAGYFADPAAPESA